MKFLLFISHVFFLRSCCKLARRTEPVGTWAIQLLLAARLGYVSWALFLPPFNERHLNPTDKALENQDKLFLSSSLRHNNPVSLCVSLRPHQGWAEGFSCAKRDQKKTSRDTFAFTKKKKKIQEKLPTCNLVFLKFTCSQEQKEEKLRDHSGARDTDSLFQSNREKQQQQKNKYARRQKHF